MNGIINSNINFQGFNFRRVSNYRSDLQYGTSLILGENLQDIVELTKHASDKKMRFLKFLTDKYNNVNFYRTTNERENPVHVNNVFKKIKSPKDLHFDIISSYKDSFKNLDRIFTSIDGSNSRLKFAHKLITKTFSSNFEKDIVPELLESKFSKKYINDYKKIESYLILNQNNKDAVKQLDKMYETKTFDPNVYNAQLKENNIKKSWPFEETEVFNAKVYLQYSSKPVDKVFSKLLKNINTNTFSIKKEDDKAILNIIKTTNKKNSELRTKILSYVPRKYVVQNFSAKNTYIEDLNKLFGLMDKDEHAYNFIKKSFEELKYNLSLTDFSEILENVSTKKLDIFHSNAINIISKTEGKERIDTLQKEITNPFFNIRWKGNDNSTFSKICKSAVNYFNILRYNLTKEEIPHVEQKVKPAVQTEVIIIPTKLTMDSTIPVIEDAPKKTSIILPILEEISNSAKKPSNTQKSNKQSIAENVFSVVSPKLGNKTLEQQRDAYIKNATKMRLSLLPEIFASVTDTRKADRAVGKYRINSSNKDVLNLYLKINGNNKKLVNYMLKKRNVDNTRMFEIKDIIETIDKAEAKIKKDKKLNSNYRANDARKYYNHLYEAKIQQFGKVKRQKSINTKA